MFRLPGYQLEQPIGYGASSRVWRARVRATGDPVAIKVLPIHDRDERAAARAEAALLQGLDHPHLVHLHDVVSCEAGLALVLDLADGGTLEALLRARGRLAPGEVVTALAPIGAALAYAHNAGVVHGDVSAANIVFTGIGLPLLSDLGVARIVGDAAPPIRSTPAYVDPAVAAGGVPSPGTDVFMLAGVALHALTGAPLWPGDTAAEAYAAEAYAAAARGQLSDVDERLRSAGVPEQVRVVIGRALQVDPARRSTAAEFALDLRHAIEPVAVELAAGRHRAGRPDRAALTYGHRVPAPAKASVRAWRPDSSSRLVRLGLAATALAAAATLLWVGHRHDGGLAQARPLAPSQGVEPTAVVANPAVPVGASGTAPAPAALTRVQAAQVLGQLDVLRARAYAQRDPSLLARVYVPGPLRSQDTAQLRAIVPPAAGCTVSRTTFTHVTDHRSRAVPGRPCARAPASKSVEAGMRRQAGGHGGGRPSRNGRSRSACAAPGRATASTR